MAIPVQISIKVTGLGLEINGAINREDAVGLPPVSVAIPAGIPSTNWTKSDADTGTVTVAEGHGLTVSDVVDLFDTITHTWRYGLTITDAQATTIALDGGAGDNFAGSSAVAGAVILSRRTSIPISFDGDNLLIFAAGMTQAGGMVLEDVGNAVLLAKPIQSSTEPLVWWNLAMFGKAITGNPATEILVSNNSTTAATFTLIGVQDVV